MLIDPNLGLYAFGGNKICFVNVDDLHLVAFGQREWTDDEFRLYCSELNSLATKAGGFR